LFSMCFKKGLTARTGGQFKRRFFFLDSIALKTATCITFNPKGVLYMTLANGNENGVKFRKKCENNY